ncbi:hypothetical protein PVAP13_5NG403240 [Panicum virgatum]|uniref:Uncharacterized protein n=1 Tax=Panicum virgatum TaxID=38727 RepID=A0A8T0S056_PANVG|nr:hypothetical protein PVAP13_5NG403240 [Panicum virgatum]
MYRMASKDYYRKVACVNTLGLETLNWNAGRIASARASAYLPEEPAVMWHCGCGSQEGSPRGGHRGKHAGHERGGAARRGGRHEPGVLRVQRALPRRRAPDLNVRARRRRAARPRVVGRRRRRAVVVVRRRRGRRRVQHGAVGADARRAPAALHLPRGRRGDRRRGGDDDRQREDRRHRPSHGRSRARQVRLAVLG